MLRLYLVIHNKENMENIINLYFERQYIQNEKEIVVLKKDIFKHEYEEISFFKTTLLGSEYCLQLNKIVKIKDNKQRELTNLEIAKIGDELSNVLNKDDIKDIFVFNMNILDA